MSNDDRSSGQPDDKPAPDPGRRSGGGFFRRINETDAGEVGVGSPAIRLAAWIAGIVLVLMVLGWALDGRY